MRVHGAVVPPLRDDTVACSAEPTAPMDVGKGRPCRHRQARAAGCLLERAGYHHRLEEDVRVEETIARLAWDCLEADEVFEVDDHLEAREKAEVEHRRGRYEIVYAALRVEVGWADLKLEFSNAGDLRVGPVKRTIGVGARGHGVDSHQDASTHH